MDPWIYTICYVIIEKYSRRLKQNHLGNKLKLTCHSFNLTCNHCRCILHTTAGHPTLWSDRLFLFDNFAAYLKNGDIMQDTCFDLYTYNESG